MRHKSALPSGSDSGYAEPVSQLTASQHIAMALFGRVAASTDQNEPTSAQVAVAVAVAVVAVAVGIVESTITTMTATVV